MFVAGRPAPYPSFRAKTRNPLGGGFGGDFGGCGTKDWLPAFAGMTGWWGRWERCAGPWCSRWGWGRVGRGAVWRGMSGCMQETLHNAQFTR